MDVKTCRFCEKAYDDVLEYGELRELCGIRVHFYCMILSTYLMQNGTEIVGISGFLLGDILKELRRAKYWICSYCKKSGATIFCSQLYCKKIFHLPCGRNNNSTHRFFGDFKSFCSDHRTIEIMRPISEDTLSTVTTCAICTENVEPYPHINTLMAQCCIRNMCFHRNCMQKVALTHEYFKCPQCNSAENIITTIIYQGIYFPSKRWRIIRCNQCESEKIFPNHKKVKSVRILTGCDMCSPPSNIDGEKDSDSDADTTSSSNGGDTISANESDPTTSINSEDNNSGTMRKRVRFSSTVDVFEFKKESYSKAPHFSPSDIKSELDEVVGSSTTRKRVHFSPTVETITGSAGSYCGPTTRSILRESRKCTEDKFKIMIKSNAEVKRAPVAYQYNTRSRTKEARKAISGSSKLEPKETEN